MSWVIHQFRWLLVWCGLMAMPGLAWAQCADLWEMSKIAQQTKSTVILNKKQGKPLKVPVSWVKSLLEVNSRIDRASGIQTVFLLCGDSEPNAFATLSQGQPVVALTLGMRDLLGADWDAYAAVLGHENAHLTLGHHQETQQRELIIGLAQYFGGMALGSLLGDGSAGARLGANLTSLGASLVSNVYSRDAEREADREGIRYTILAGYDPNGAIRLHKALNTHGSFLSSHPASEERIAELQRTIAEMQAR